MSTVTEESRLLQQSKRGLLHIIFSRTMLTVLLLLANCLLLFGTALGILRDLPLLFGGLTAFTAVILILVLSGPENPSVKLSWCIFIAVLPLPGSVLYFFARFDIGSRLGKRVLAQVESESRRFLPDGSGAREQFSQTDPDFYNLSSYLERCGYPAYPAGETKYFPLGEEMLQEMLKQLEKAEAYIFLEYFIIAPGKMWGQILDILHRKAMQGVQVRVLYDGMNALANLPYNYPKQLEKLGIQCKVFSPVMPFVSTHYNNRDHRKILVIDGKVAFTGGVNLQDRYINAEQVFGHWKDTGVMISGAGVNSFTLLFLQLWNAGQKERCYEPYLRAAAADASQGCVIPFGDSPKDSENIGKMVYLNILNQARRYVYIMTPYLILDGEMLTALQFAAKRGVDVRLVLPHIPDKKTAFALAKSHYKDLLQAGVRIYEYTPGFVHAKVFLSDDVNAVVGTINLDYRSLYHHFECGVYLYRCHIMEEIKMDFAQTMAVSTEITIDDCKKHSIFYRLLGLILKVAAPLM